MAAAPTPPSKLDPSVYALYWVCRCVSIACSKAVSFKWLILVISRGLYVGCQQTGSMVSINFGLTCVMKNK